MKNKITSLFIIVLLSNLAWAESEPEAIKTKDLMDKIERSEITTEGSQPDLNNVLPDMEMPKIEFDEKIDNNSKTNNKARVKSKTVVKTAAKNNVVFAKRPISLMQLLNNDKIVISRSQTYVYRLINKTITQYKIKDKVPLKSLGLKTSGKNSFYITDVALLKKDAKALKNKSKSKPKVNRSTRVKSTKVKSTKAKIVKVKNVEKVQSNNSISPKIAAKRKSMEDKLNRGKAIKKTITLRALQTNDEIIVSGDVQLVIRKKKATSGVKKYWLIEKMDITNPAIVKKSKNVYKLIRSYQ